MKEDAKQLPLQFERPWHEELTAWEAKMKQARHEQAVNEENFQQCKRLAEAWAVEIRQAFLNRQPCPIRVTGVEGVHPLDALKYQMILEWAFQLACVPKECLPPAPADGDHPTS
jgi:hypothetical protein